MLALLRNAAVAGALLAATTAHATSYDFSYHFLNGELVSGSFDGTANGKPLPPTSSIIRPSMAPTPKGRVSCLTPPAAGA
jgi:hypothetical protein